MMGRPAALPSAGASAAKAPLCRRCRLLMAKSKRPLEAGMGNVSWRHYTARDRPITLLFPHDKPLKGVSVRRNVPITTPRQLKRKRPGEARPFTIVSGWADHLAAVGSGAG